MRRIGKHLREAVAAATEDIRGWDDEKLSAAVDRAHAIMVQIMRAVPERSGKVKISLAELVLWEVQFYDCIKMFKLPSPRGGAVADHLPPGYDASGGGYREELSWNVLPWDLPVEVKLDIAARRWADAVKMREAPGGNTQNNCVRMLIAEAQYALLYGWEEKLSRPRPKMAREQMLNVMAAFFEFAAPSLAHLKAVQ
jgi:hypothetical protein